MSARNVAQALIACYLLLSVSADLPNHCLREQVAGEEADIWTLHLGEAKYDKDSIDCKPEGKHQGGFDVHKKLKVSLNADNFKATEVGTDGKKTGTVGTWTMIYDEGWELRLGGKKYFAWSKYENRKGHGMTSMCQETSNGMFHNDDGTAWGCFWGKRTGKPAENGGGQAPWFPGGEEDMQESTSLLSTMEDQALYRPEVKLVEAINKKDLGWKAKLYPELYDGYTMAQIRQRMGFGKGIHDMGDANVDALLADLQLGGTGNGAGHGAGDGAHEVGPRKVEDFPSGWDWRNHNGQNFINDAYDQGFCGSCWAVAASDVLSARVAIATNNTLRPQISAQEMLTCSNPFYAQACGGGFPYLGFKYVQDYGIGTSDCYKYSGDGKSCQLPELKKKDSGHCGAKSRIGVKDYYYVGGGYGGGNVVAMMHEIMTNGPISVCITPSSQFQHYSTGIFEEDETLNELQLNPFQAVTHAVVIVGWGTGSNGKKYWICKNSEGKAWGDNGFFYVPLGKNAMSIENMPTAATVILPENWKSDFTCNAHHSTDPIHSRSGHSTA
jgi:cathepsin C